MRKRRQSGTGDRRGTKGFSLIEMLIVLLLLSIIMGSVFTQIDLVQKRFRSEETKLDVFQTSREFIDQMVRDIHGAGFPNIKMYTPGALSGTAPYYEDSNLIAAGIIFISETSVRFEGDIDGDGIVDAVAYTLITDTLAAGNQNCPCVRRSQVQKAAGVHPLDQVEDYRTQVENVSVISGRPIFIAYDRFGNVVDTTGGIKKSIYHPQDTTDPVNNIWTVQIQLNVRAATADVGTTFHPEVYLTATAQVNN